MSHLILLNFRPADETTVIIKERKVIYKTCMRSYLERQAIQSFDKTFTHIHTLVAKEVKALANSVNTQARSH